MVVRRKADDGSESKIRTMYRDLAESSFKDRREFVRRSSRVRLKIAKILSGVRRKHVGRLAEKFVGGSPREKST